MTAAGTRAAVEVQSLGFAAPPGAPGGEAAPEARAAAGVLVGGKDFMLSFDIHKTDGDGRCLRSL